jgi:hypothetical protein
MSASEKDKPFQGSPMPLSEIDRSPMHEKSLSALLAQLGDPMRNENEENDHNAALTEGVTESALVPASVAPHDGVSDERRIFTAGWSAGFQEALEPDRYPDRDRCEDAFREWTLLRADELASPPTTEPLPITELEREARHLATYAASINWQPGDNTREWLLGLRDLIEHVQALTRPNPREMHSDLDLGYLDDEGECPLCNGTGERECFEDSCCCEGGHPCPRCL